MHVGGIVIHRNCFERYTAQFAFGHVLLPTPPETLIVNGLKTLVMMKLCRRAPCTAPSVCGT